MAERRGAPADGSLPALRKRRQSHWRGQWSEILAAGLLLAKGYRILARRWRSPVGEIDLIAVRGRRLAFVEVKHRATLDDCHEAITPAQARRIHRAADYWLARHAAYRTHDLAFDAIHWAPGRLPRHLEHAL